ncbi:hypothetical protein ISF_01743 [Cordyceps fumosorosea ARSEF 2679]|uniref:DUF974 domain-containing protein n=1 Tax=Cordyceps fumosorosea (strain ARSEF 2679) TaxID=1081104 RepID=A0A162JMT6_CORFA|nr:hypothetical protein ISF_01743 [Cordyceps fumosorosea ARSEF 2679]OAA71192.1 hypothetical protein ISF_01743 [Cordyceps fumosorosea ARSEF 2679]
MSHQRYLSHDPIKEPHSVSVKVLRLSCPSLVSQYPVEPPFPDQTSPLPAPPSPLPASLAHSTTTSSEAPAATTNPSPFVLSPVLNLPVSFGSAYVGETFRCTLCANNDLLSSSDDAATAQPTDKKIRDVRVEAEMKTPGPGKAQRLELGPAPTEGGGGGGEQAGGVDLPPGGTLQRVVSFDLKEEGNHVLAVTVSYYEATETSGRARTFRKLYQFICKPSLIVRTKVGALPTPTPAPSRHRRWVLEAQLENCSDDAMQLERVVVEPEPGLAYRDCNWTAREDRPVLRPGEVEQLCFVVEDADGDGGGDDGGGVVGSDARMVLGVLGIGWRGAMGSRGYLSTGKLGTRIAAAR